MALLALLTDCLFFSGVRECFAFAEGSALCVGAKPNVPLVRWQKFNFFVRWGVLFSLGSACVSPSWSAGLC